MNLGSQLNQTNLGSSANPPSLNTVPIPLPTRFGLLKTILFVVLLSILLFFISNIVSRLLLLSIGTANVIPPFNVIFALFLLPFGLDIILLTPLIWFLTKNFFNYFKIPVTSSKTWLTSILIIVLVIFFRTGLFRLNSSRGENYIKQQVNETVRQRDEIVGTENAEFIYIDSHPSYSDAHKLENIIVTLRAKLPKKGDYQIDGYLFAENVIPSNHINPDLSLLGRLKFSYDDAIPEQEIQIIFDTAELHKYNYEGELAFSIYNVWRIGIEIDAPFGGGTTDSTTVKFVDPGTFEVGPYPLYDL